MKQNHPVSNEEMRAYLEIFGTEQDIDAPIVIPSDVKFVLVDDVDKLVSLAKQELADKDISKKNIVIVDSLSSTTVHVIQRDARVYPSEFDEKEPTSPFPPKRGKKGKAQKMVMLF